MNNLNQSCSGGSMKLTLTNGVRGIGYLSLAICLGTFSLSGADADLREVITVPKEVVQEMNDGVGVQITDFHHLSPSTNTQEGLFGTPLENSIFLADARLRTRLENAIDSQDEEELVKFLELDIGEDYKRKILLALGAIYERQHSPSREIALYEKFIIECPKDPEIPQLYLKLGRLYRETGAIKTALVKFYNVLNVALNVPVQNLNDYRELSHRAQIEIAETYFSIGAYDQSAKYFNRLLKLNLSEEDHLNVFFKYAYTVYLSADYEGSASTLQAFINEYPNSELTPEARYLLSETYIKHNDPKAAMKETLDLLSVESEKIETDPAAWLHWKKRTGNKLANQFYQDGNYLDALKIYQAMITLSDNPEWGWPVLYQIGLCYEKLDMKPKALEFYQGILDEESNLSGKSKNDLTLMSIRDMAQWRIDRLEEDIDVDSRLDMILEQS